MSGRTAGSAQPEVQGPSPVDPLNVFHSQRATLGAAQPGLDVGSQDRLLLGVAPPRSGDHEQPRATFHTGCVQGLGDTTQGLLRPQAVEIDDFGLVMRALRHGGFFILLEQQRTTPGLNLVDL